MEYGFIVHNKFLIIDVSNQWDRHFTVTQSIAQNKIYSKYMYEFKVA